MDVVMDSVSPVCNDYEKNVIFPFTAIESVTFDFDDMKESTVMERLELATKMD